MSDNEETRLLVDNDTDVDSTREEVDSREGSDSDTERDDDAQDELNSAYAEEQSRTRRRRRRSDNYDIEAQDHSQNGKDEPQSKSAAQAVSESKDIIKTMLHFLFSNAGARDKLILFIGSVFAIIHGITFPFVAVLFGSMTNSFIQQSVSGYANVSSEFSEEVNTTETPNSQLETLVPKKLASIFDIINDVVLKAFTEHEALTKEQFLQNVHLVGILFFWLAIAIFVSSFFQVFCWEWAAATQKYKLRESIVKKILRQHLLWFQQHDTGELLGNIFREVSHVHQALGSQFGSIVEHCAMLVMSSLIAISISWRLALVFLSVMPFIVLRTLALGQKVAIASRTGDDLWAKAESTAMGALCNADTVIAFNQQRWFVTEFGTQLERAVDQLFKKYHLAALGRAFLVFIIYGSYAVGFWYACRLLGQGAISAGEIYTIFLSVTMGTIALTNIMNSTTLISSAYSSARHLSEFGLPLPKKDCFCNEGRYTELDGEIEFVKVSFAYPGCHKVLNELSFKIAPGKTVAILSKVGEGKSTIAKLILGVYEPARGKIKIDGEKINKLSLETLRRDMGIVLQQSLMSETEVDANIKAARRFASYFDVQDVKSLVDPENKVETFTDFARLCGRDRLKINIMRGLVHDPAILILDECFTDTLTPEKDSIRKSVLGDRKDKTTIILTNDISILESDDVDLIYFLKDGKILPANIGPPDELKKTGGQDNEFNEFIDFNEKLNQALGELEEEPTPPRLLRRGVRFKEERVEGFFELFDLGSSYLFLGLSLIGVTLTGVQLTVFAYYFVEMFETFSKTGDQLASEAIFWAEMLLVLAGFAAISIWLRILFTGAASLYVMLSIRVTAFASVLRRPKYCYNKTPKTTPMALGTKVVNQARHIKNVLETHLPEGVSTAVALICMGAIVTSLVWQIGLVLIIGVYSLLIVLTVLQYKIRKSGQGKFFEQDAEISSLITTASDLMELVQTHSMQAHYLEKYRDTVLPILREYYKQAFAFSVLSALCETLFFIFFGVSFLYGSHLISTDAIQPQFLFKVFFSMAFCVVSFNQIVALMPYFAKAAGSLEITSDVVREENEWKSTMDALNDEGEKLKKFKGDIEFENVWFRFSPEHHSYLFKGLSFKIAAGKTAVIQGMQSFGGSTLLALIQRFYDVEAGQILLDGQNIQGLNIGQVRDHIGWVPENISFFTGSIKENIIFGQKVGDVELKKVLTKVKLIDTFGRHLNVRRGWRHWSSLSRGKKVLTAIARALIKNPKILLLDNPIRSLSCEEKLKVIDVLKEIKKNRTCIIITDYKDSVAVLEDADDIIGIQMGVAILESDSEPEPDEA